MTQINRFLNAILKLEEYFSLTMPNLQYHVELYQNHCLLSSLVCINHLVKELPNHLEILNYSVMVQ